MNEPAPQQEPQQAPQRETQQETQVTSNLSRPIATEDTYVVLIRTLSNGAQIVEYVDRQGEGKLITVVRVDK